MLSNELSFTFSPHWLSFIDADSAADVRDWLSRAGVNLNLCPGFDFDGVLITTRYYQVNDAGSPMMTDDGDPVYEHQVREFPAARPVPDAVKEF